MFDSENTERFFEYIGGEIPGFDYKFETDSKSQYEATKETFYQQSTTQNAVK